MFVVDRHRTVSAVALQIANAFPSHPTMLAMTSRYEKGPRTGAEQRKRNFLGETDFE
jgi:hypothetical protein